MSFVKFLWSSTWDLVFPCAKTEQQQGKAVPWKRVCGPDCLASPRSWHVGVEATEKQGARLMQAWLYIML